MENWNSNETKIKKGERQAILNPNPTSTQRTYWLECETIYCCVLVADDMQMSRNLKLFEDTVCDGQDKSYMQRAWKHAERLAKQFAKRHGLTATYTTHPNRSSRACWLVK